MHYTYLLTMAMAFLTFAIAAPDGASPTSTGRPNSIYNSQYPSPTPYSHPSNCTDGCGGMCGDKMIQYPYEECDLGFGPHGNGAPGSGCTWDCKICGRCGDGHKDPGEECDAGDKNGQYASGCSTNCTLCGYCGDGIVDYEQGEECDYGWKYNGARGMGCDANCKKCAGSTPTTIYVSATPY